MLTRINRLITRTDLFASHCFGRIKSCVPLSLFYAFDGLFNGAVKKSLTYLSMGKLPALVTFLYYLYSFFNKAKESYEKHPDSSDLNTEHKRFVATTEMIQNQLRRNKLDADGYLHQLDMEEKKIEKLLDIETQALPEEIYPILIEIFQKIHPEQMSFFHNLLDSLLHGITHLNEFLLLKYFADINLLADEGMSMHSVLGFGMLICGLLSSLQTFSFNNRAKDPTSDKLLECIPHHFFKFQEGRSANTEFTAEHREAILKFAAANALQKCSLRCG